MTTGKSSVNRNRHHVHRSHDEAILRLKRAVGHLKKVISMIEEHRPCVDLLQQLSAVISALVGCRTLLFQDHLHSCIKPALKPGQEDLIREIEMIVQRTMKV